MLKKLLSKLIDLVRSRFVWINIGTALMGLLLLILLVTIFLRFYTRHGESITVPDLTGLNINSIEKHLKGSPLRIHIMDSTYVKNKEPLAIINQTPKAGEKVKENRQIYVTVNAAHPPQVIMPNLIDSSLKDAQTQLEINELVLGEMNHKPHPFKNVVIEMTTQDRKKIKPGEPIYKGTVINLTVGDGLGKTIFELPDYTGIKYSEARISIQMLNLMLGKVHETDLIEDQNWAYVIHQIPSAGARVAEGDEVELFISSNPSNTSIPPVPSMNDPYHTPQTIRNNNPIDSNNVEY